MKKGFFVKIIGILLIVSFVSACSTMMTVNAVDPNGSQISDVRVIVNGQDIGQTPNTTTKVSNFIGDDTSIRVVKEGYVTRTVGAEKEIKIPVLIIGLLFTYIPLLWVYGPKALQTVVLTPE